MDVYSLVAAHFRAEAQPMTAKVEARYYASQIALPRLSRRRFGTIAALVGVIFILGASLRWAGIYAAGY